MNIYSKGRGSLHIFVRPLGGNITMSNSPYDKDSSKEWKCDSCGETFDSRKSWYNHAVNFGGCPNK